MKMPAVEVRQLAYAYPDGRQALHDIDFGIAAGESVAVIGRNGAGKSTLLQHLNGILLPARGEVRIGGRSVGRDTLPEIRRAVGLVFQDSDDQLFMPTVYDDVAFGPLNQGLAGAELERVVRQALDRVGAAHLADRPPYRLSTGEKRAVAIAGVLAMAPQVLVMDEPSNGLDPLARRRLIDLLRGFDHTRVIATHDLDLVLDLCSRVLVMADGRLHADGRPAVIFADAALLARCGLELPLSLQPRADRLATPGFHSGP